MAHKKNASYEYGFSVRSPDYRASKKSPSLLAVWQLFTNMERVCIDMTEAKFKAFREGLKVAGYDLEGVRRILLPYPEAEDVE